MKIYLKPIFLKNYDNRNYPCIMISLLRDKFVKLIVYERLYKSKKNAIY